jgi:hypothetical protein
MGELRGRISERFLAWNNVRKIQRRYSLKSHWRLVNMLPCASQAQVPPGPALSSPELFTDQRAGVLVCNILHLFEHKLQDMLAQI